MPTRENFQVNQWPSLNYFVYLVSLHQVKNYYAFYDWYIKTNIKKKVSLIYVFQIFYNLEIVN